MAITNKQIKILAVETSCDETAASVLEFENFNINNSLKILSDIVSSQIKLHSKYGGVYPELASREHTKNIIPVIKKSLYLTNPKSEILNSKQNIKLKSKNFNLQSVINDIDAIAVTTGPGLIGSLLTGVNTAKTLSYVFNKPIIPVNHLEGHIYANFIGENSKLKTQSSKQNSKSKIQNLDLPKFPLLALVVSGGHTSLILMKNHLNYEIIGETYDDAAGEAYDKVAAMLGLKYPGGPVIDAIAAKFLISNKNVILKSEARSSNIGNPSSKSPISNSIVVEDDKKSGIEINNFPKFPRPMINEDNFDFSFSGLKTSVLYYLKKQSQPYSEKLISQVCYEFQEAVTDVLVAKTLRAAKQHQVKSIVLGGGVAANSRLREKLKTEVENSLKIKNFKFKIGLFIPPIKFCTDNAAVIATVAAYKMLAGQTDKWYNIETNSNLKLK